MKNHILKIHILFLLLFTAIYVQAGIPSWLIGKWTDGNAIIEITSDSKMRIYENDILTKEGSFTYDNSGFIEAMWDKDLKPEDEYFLCFNSNSNWLAHEGGDHLTKLPDNIGTNNNDNQEKDYSGKLNSNVFIECSKRCWKNISWVYGEWKIPTNHPSGKTYFVKITPFYYQETTEKTDSITDFSELSKKWYKVMEGEHNLLGNVIFIDDLYFDLGAKRIYLSNLDKKIYLEQTAEYTTIQIIYWTIIGFLGVGILLCLYFLIRKLGSAIISLGKKFINALIGAFRKINTAIKAFSGNATKVISSVPKKVVATAKRLKENSNNDNKKRKLSTTSWCVIAGLYILIFWDIAVGFLILLMTLAYVIVQKKVAPETKEKILAYCKDKLRPIISEPMLAKGLTWLVVGVLIYRIFSGFIGFLIIVCSIIFLVLMKFAPSVSGIVYGFYEKIIFTIKPILRKKWWKIAAILCLIILPLSMSMQQSSVFLLTPIGEDIQEHHINSELKKLENSEEELSPRESLRKEYLELKKQYDAALRKVQNPFSFQEHQDGVAELESIQRQLDDLERRAMSMGIPSLLLL